MCNHLFHTGISCNQILAHVKVSWFMITCDSMWKQCFDMRYAMIIKSCEISHVKCFRIHIGNACHNMKMVNSTCGTCYYYYFFIRTWTDSSIYWDYDTGDHDQLTVWITGELEKWSDFIMVSIWEKKDVLQYMSTVLYFWMEITLLLFFYIS